MRRGRHALAIARLLVERVEAEPQRVSRRLLLPQIRWAAAQPNRAGELGVLDLVERARDEHLANLDADDGLAVLGVAAEEVLTEAAGLLDRGPARTCPRCGARLSRRRRACARCRHPVPR
jgi:hypothetical protein